MRWRLHRRCAQFRVVHHRQGLALFGETSEYLARVHPQFYNFECDPPANRLALLGQVDGAHPAFADGSNDLITAEVVITRRSWRQCLRSGIVRADRAIESALDQALGTQSRNATGTQIRFAVRAVCHVDQSCSSNFMLFCRRPCNFQSPDSLFVAVSRMDPAKAEKESCDEKNFALFSASVGFGDRVDGRVRTSNPAIHRGRPRAGRAAARPTLHHHRTGADQRRNRPCAIRRVPRFSLETRENERHRKPRLGRAKQRRFWCQPLGPGSRASRHHDCRSEQ